MITGDNRRLDIEVPRDRDSTFNPITVPKYEKRLPLFNNQIISMYAFGMTCRDIQTHLKQVYGVDVSPELITRVTDSGIEDVKYVALAVNYEEKKEVLELWIAEDEGAKFWTWGCVSSLYNNFPIIAEL